MKDAYQLLLLQQKEEDFYLYIIAFVTCGEKLSNIISFLNKKNIEFSIYKYIIYFRKYFTRMLLLSVKNEYKELITPYNKILKIYSKLAKDIGLTQPLEFGIFFEYLLYNGYFSINKEFHYSLENKKYGPFSIISGTGVCINMSMLLKDFLSCCDVDSMVLINYFKGQTKDIRPYIIGNHAAVLINDDISFLYDITNRTIAYKNGYKKFKSINDKYEYLDRSQNGINIKVIENRGNLIKYRQDCYNNVVDKVVYYKLLVDSAYNCVKYDMIKIDNYIQENEKLSDLSRNRKGNNV